MEEPCRPLLSADGKWWQWQWLRTWKRYFLHLPGLQLLVGPGEAHGLEALEVCHLSSQPGNTSTVGVRDTGREGLDVPCCLGQLQPIPSVLKVAVACDKGGKENNGKKYGAIHHAHCSHGLPPVKSNHLVAILILLYLYMITWWWALLGFFLVSLVGWPFSLLRYLSVISSNLSAENQITTLNWNSQKLDFVFEFQRYFAAMRSLVW